MKPSHFARALCVASATIATSAFSPVLAQSPAAAPASAASAPLFAVRSEVGKALNEAVDLFRAGKVAEARDRVEKAQAAIADPQAAERSVMHRLRGLFAMQLGHMPEAAQQLEAAIGAGAQSPQDQLLCLESLARVQFNLKAYPTASGITPEQADCIASGINDDKALNQQVWDAIAASAAGDQSKADDLQGAITDMATKCVGG